MGKDVAKIVQEAAEAAKLVPEHLQEAAFNKVFDALMVSDAEGSPSTGPTEPKRKPAKKKGSARKEVGKTLDDVDRTAHPEINHDNSGLENALRLLRAAKDDLGIDGLSGSEIARVLTDKFRCRISKQAVGEALNGAGRYVDRKKEGRSVLFRLMAPGEDYLDGRAGGADPATTTGGKTRTASTKKTKAKKAPAQKPSSKKKARAKKAPTKKAPKKKGGSSRVGAAAAMTILFEAGFFAEPRTIGAITKKLKHDRGRTFKANELSPQLLRWLRSGKVTRAQNSEGQYEYSAA